MMTKEEIKKHVEDALFNHINTFDINDHDNITIKKYSFSIPEITLWARTGSRLLGNFYIKCIEKEDLNSIISQAVDLVYEYINGYIHCSDCGALMPVSEIEGYKRSYFAGVYCQHCWDTKWRAREAAETYD